MRDTTRFIWVRHLPVAAHGVYVGQSSVEAIVPPPATLQWSFPSDAIWVASPLLRARQTMYWLKQCLSLPSDETLVISELMEQSFGEWEGKKYSDVIFDSKNLETVQPPRGEDFEQVIHRVHEWIDQALENYEGSTIIAVCHAGVIRAALAHALRIPARAALRFQMDYVSQTRVSYIKHGGHFLGTVESFNTPLLPPPIP